ncbi:hypothetical protein QUB63_26445 [Microcoleus sp. ARI1-B5]|uniref:hypothetical protein n=1 Tax=unclassified Microcoleus TaxID=2642155 RepID=UPI002FD1C17E
MDKPVYREFVDRDRPGVKAPGAEDKIPKHLKNTYLTKARRRQVREKRSEKEEDR